MLIGQKLVYSANLQTKTTPLYRPYKELTRFPDPVSLVLLLIFVVS